VEIDMADESVDRVNFVIDKMLEHGIIATVRSIERRLRVSLALFLRRNI
jgi:hypothetical protein